jgi:hypothetical protein
LDAVGQFVLSTKKKLVKISPFIDTGVDPTKTVKAQLPLEGSEFRLLKVTVNGEK